VRTVLETAPLSEATLSGSDCCCGCCCCVRCAGSACPPPPSNNLEKALAHCHCTTDDATLSWRGAHQVIPHNTIPQTG
jgi:hypothetical protein